MFEESNRIETLRLKQVGIILRGRVKGALFIY